MFHLSPLFHVVLVPQELRVGHPWREALRGGGAAGSEAGTAGGAAAAEDGGGRGLNLGFHMVSIVMGVPLKMDGLYMFISCKIR